jgi:ankyrin repeat protein
LLFCAVHYGLIKVIEELKKRGMDLYQSNEEGLTILHLAARQENSPVLCFLLQNGAAPLVHALWQNMWTPLQEASKAGCSENVKLLMEVEMTIVSERNLSFDGKENYLLDAQSTISK